MRVIRLRRIVGFVKDKVSLARARARTRFAKWHVALIYATSHGGSPTAEKCVRSVLNEARTGSRMEMSYCVRLLMDRLNKTANWAVALKCLTLIHKGLRFGGFMFQDQVSIYPARGGRNYLNLSKFKDNSSPFASEVSFWIRWYAKFLEQRLVTCRSLGNFLDSKRCDSKLNVDKVADLGNDGLVREVLDLNDLLQQICECPTHGNVATNELVRDALRLVILDSFRTQDELKIRLREVCERVNSLTSLEIACVVQVCERLTVEFMSFTCLVELGLVLNLLEAKQCPEKVLFADYELTKIKNVLEGHLNPL